MISDADLACEIELASGATRELLEELAFYRKVAPIYEPTIHKVPGAKFFKVQSATFCPKCGEWHRVEPETITSGSEIRISCDCGEVYPVRFD